MNDFPPQPNRGGAGPQRLNGIDPLDRVIDHIDPTSIDRDLCVVNVAQIFFGHQLPKSFCILKKKF